MKKGVILSDMHCGHLVGLCPPPWQCAGDGWRDKVRNTQKQAWEWFDGEMATLGELDVLICNGDAVDGDGYRSGGTEQVSTDPTVQAEMATYILQRYMSRKTKLYMTYGTPSHTGTMFDTEGLIAKDCGAEKIEGQAFLDIDGVVFDIKHKIGSSGIPHGRATALKKAQLWNKLWNYAQEQPDADVVVRSHVHYHQFAGDPDFGLAMTTPALQACGSKYGARQCEGRVHFGFISFTCDKGEISWKSHIAKLEAHKSKLSKV
jgi:hypothetical protein